MCSVVYVCSISQRRQWHPTPVLLPGKSHGWRSLVGCSPWGRKELDTTEQLHFHFSLSRIGEANGSPLQWSCMENPRDGGAWWAAVYGVAQSRTRLKRLSSSSSSSISGVTQNTFLPMTVQKGAGWLEAGLAGIVSSESHLPWRWPKEFHGVLWAEPKA